MTNTSPVLTRGQWLKRCAAVFIQEGLVGPDFATEMAEICLNDTFEGDLTENPEDAAREEMSYWAD